MRLYRLVKARYRSNPFSPEGARRYGGRWNSPGTAVVYAADSVALAALEQLVHTRQPAHLRDFLLCTVDVPERLVMYLPRESTPGDWRSHPPPTSTQRLGDEWVRSQSSLALGVPSVTIPQQSNFLVNPLHRGFADIGQKVIVEPFAFDERLLGR